VHASQKVYRTIYGPRGQPRCFYSTRPPRFGDQTKEYYASCRRVVECWIKLENVAPDKPGVARVECLSSDPKEFVKTTSDQLLFFDQSGTRVLLHLNKFCQNCSEMILNGRVSAFWNNRRLPSISISAYIAGCNTRQYISASNAGRT
jgi:hypothetical protein